MDIFKKRFTVTSAAWVQVGVGPLEVALVSDGVVYVATGASAPGGTTAGTALTGAAIGDAGRKLTITAGAKAWARAVGASVEVETEMPVDLPPYDHIGMSYTDGNLTGVTYRMGGSSGTTVATMTLTYDANGNLTSVTRS